MGYLQMLQAKQQHFHDGVEYFEKLLNLPGDPESFAAVAPRCPVFRFDPLPQNTRDEQRAVHL